MAGTFRPGDCLILKPVPLHHIRKGDVVIFRIIKDQEKEEEKHLAHRVMAVSPGELVTRGDNNPYCDDSPVTPDNLVGRVEIVERSGKKKRVRGDSRGLIRARLLHTRLILKKILKFFFKNPYRLIKKSRIVSYLWHPVFKIVYFKTDKGLLVKYLHGERTAAYWWLDQGRFQCKKPYDLVLRRPDL